MPGDATPPPLPPPPPPPPPELPPGLLAEYLESARAQLSVLAGLAERLVAAGGDREALDALRRETHKVHGSAGSYGFMAASRLAAGMEATVKDWAARPDESDVERGSLARWFVRRLAELLGLELPRASAPPPVRAAPLPRVGPPPRPAPRPPTQAPQRPTYHRPGAPPASGLPPVVRETGGAFAERARGARGRSGRRRPRAGGDLRGGRRGARRAARVRVERAGISLFGLA